MIIIGLTGSIAMGKSEVAKFLAIAGLAVFDADAAVHGLYDSPAGATLIRTLAPEAIVGDKVDRKILTDLILKDSKLLQKIEAAVHAAIKERRNDFIATAKSKSAIAVVLDIPLLFETAANNAVDVTVVVSAPAVLQYQRAMARPGMTKARLDMILSRQWSDTKKRQHADFIIENDGDLTILQQRTRHVLQQILQQKV